MKKCPYCAEEIQNEAILCRYCGSSLEKKATPPRIKKCPYCAELIDANSNICKYCGSDLIAKTKRISTSKSKNQLPGGKVFLGFLLLILSNWSIGFIVFFMFGNALSVGMVSNLLARIIIGVWAVKDRSYKKDYSDLRKLGVFFLAFIPIGSWYAIYYASRFIVRKKRLNTLVFSIIMLISLVVILWVIILYMI